MGYWEVFKFLVKNGVIISMDDDYALRLASRNGHLEVVKFLVENGADIHTYGDYALQVAADKGDLKMVKFSVGYGANVRADDDWAFRVAAENGHLEVVKFLVENGADPSVLDRSTLKPEVMKIIDDTFIRKYGNLQLRVCQKIMEEGISMDGLPQHIQEYCRTWFGSH